MGSPALQIVSSADAIAPALNPLQGITKVLRQPEAHCGVPQDGVFPFEIGVINRAKVRPLFTLPALIGSKLIPLPVVDVPAMLLEVLLVFQPAGIVLPLGQSPVALSLKYQRYW